MNISDNITEVGDFAFAQNSSLSEVTLGSGIEGIERGTFANCESLVSIEIPDNITYIGDSAFKDTGLTTVNIPESVTSVGKSAFAECSLEEVNIEEYIDLEDGELGSNDGELDFPEEEFDNIDWNELEMPEEPK